jgi:hypothetical protein
VPGLRVTEFDEGMLPAVTITVPPLMVGLPVHVLLE